MARAQGDQALATAYRSIDDNPKNVTAYFFAGTMEELRGRSQKAEDLYRQALQVDPTYGPAANNLAYLMLENGESVMVYQKQKNAPAARKQLQRTLQLNPNFPEADKIRKTLNQMNSGATTHRSSVGFRSTLSLRSRNLNVGRNVRVSAFFVTRIHSRRSVAVGRPVGYYRVCVQRSRIQHSIDLGERSA